VVEGFVGLHAFVFATLDLPYLNFLAFLKMKEKYFIWYFVI